jgi:hypothetical protein
MVGWGNGIGASGKATLKSGPDLHAAYALDQLKVS